MDVSPDKQVLIDLVRTQMTFGKYKGWLICDIPLYYLVWLRQKDAIPKGKVGELLQNAYEIKSNELEPMLRKLKQLYG